METKATSCNPTLYIDILETIIEVDCELSLDPEVAILFGREIGQSNDGILLTDCWNLQG